MTLPVIRLDRAYSHPPAAVWQALTDPELHARWWAAGDVQPIVGHKFHLDMGKWGLQPCVVLEVQPQRMIKYLFATGTLNTTITWLLEPEGAGTRLTLTHEGFNLDTPMGRFAYEGMGSGWPSVLERLAAVI